MANPKGDKRGFSTATTFTKPSDTEHTSQPRLGKDLTAELNRKDVVWKCPQAKLFELVQPILAPCPLSGLVQLYTNISYQPNLHKANATLRGRKQQRSLERFFPSSSALRIPPRDKFSHLAPKWQAQPVWLAKMTWRKGLAQVSARKYMQEDQL